MMNDDSELEGNFFGIWLAAKEGGRRDSRQGEGRWHGADAFYVLFSVSFAPYVRVLGSLASVLASTTLRGFDGPFPSSDKITKYSPLLAICSDFEFGSI